MSDFLLVAKHALHSINAFTYDALAHDLKLMFNLLFFLSVSTCFRIKNFDVPHQVTQGSQILLKCLFELEKDRLVNLKWYFNDKEFLRFEPKSKRDETQIFQLPTLNLEVSLNGFLLN